MVENRALWLIGMAAGFLLVGYGVLYFISPDAGLRVTYHEAARLPLVMGGRYVFIGVMLIAALLYGSARVLAVLLSGLAFLAFVDTAIYWDVAPIPHAAVGAICIAAALYFFSKRKADV